jgi:3-oxoacyl-[acyl-carrier protein] reductase
MARAERVEPAAALRRLEASQPAGRVARPAEVAAAVAFLCSEEASAVNGEALRVSLGSHW